MFYLLELFMQKSPIDRLKVIMQGKLIKVAYTLWNPSCVYITAQETVHCSTKDLK